MEFKLVILVGAMLYLANCESLNSNYQLTTPATITLVHGQFAGFGGYQENQPNRHVGEGLTIPSNGGSVIFNQMQTPPKRVIGDGLTIPSDGGIVTGSFSGFGPQKNNENVRTKRQQGDFGRSDQSDLFRQNGFSQQTGGFPQQENFGLQRGFNQRQNNFDQDRFPQLLDFGQQSQQNGFDRQNGFGQQNSFRQQLGFGQQNSQQNGFARQNGFGQQNSFRQQLGFGQQNNLNQQRRFEQQGRLTTQGNFARQNELNRFNNFQQSDRLRRQGDFFFQQGGFPQQGSANSNTITTTTPASTVSTTSSPAYLNCLANCPTTNEYNPVCGSDSLNYHNRQKLTCAQNCGKNVQQLRLGTCNPL